jgi:hypothetical protein
MVMIRIQENQKKPKKLSIDKGKTFKVDKGKTFYASML